ncbi:hypothetical protein B6U99_03010 [Candidatus Geothermarchaeota archaeon ex4572_27]|nr:MAG: hypothetical protein B6U99_03010 [Candidatus Geothermarchaeota archaeon ex4572_27]
MPTGGIRVVGASAVGQEEVAELLRSYRIYNAVVKLSGEVTLSDIEDHILGIRTVKPGLAVVAGDGLEAYRLVRGEVSGGPLSLASKSLVEEVLRGLDLIRVYTKPHGGEVEERPVVLKRGARVIDLAREIHSRLAENFRYAVVIRGGRRIRTSKNFQLEDGDIVTIYA